jgi:hypothetical protein
VILAPQSFQSWVRYDLLASYIFHYLFVQY